MTEISIVLLTGLSYPRRVDGGLNRVFDEIRKELTTRDLELIVHFGDRSWGTGLLGLLATNLRLAGLCQSCRPQVLSVHVAPYAVLAALVCGRPLVVSFYRPWAGEAAASGRIGGCRFRQMLERPVYRRATRCTVHSRSFARLLAIGVLGLGVDEEDHLGSGFTERYVEPTALIVRRLESRMGIDQVLDVWPGVVESVPDARLLIVGDGKERRKLENRADSQGIANSVEFRGRVSESELRAAYRKAWVSVVPSRSLEGFGLVVLESLVRGTPCIVSDVGGLPEIMNRFDSSFVFRKDDNDGLQRRMLAAHSAAPSTLTAESCVAFARRFSWNSTATELLATLEETVVRAAAE